MQWQVQEAKQRFSELLRRTHEEGPQMITRHGEEVAVMVDIAWFRNRTDPEVDLIGLLSHHEPEDAFADEIDRIVSARKNDVPERDDVFADLGESTS